MFKNKTGREVHTGHYLAKRETKDYNVVINWRIFLDEPVNNDLWTSDNIRKNASGQGDGYTTGCFKDYIYFKEHYNLILIDLTKQKN